MKIEALSSRLVLLAYIFVGQLGVSSVAAWSNEEFEMFDLVEEIGENFYEVLGIPQDAGDKEIRKAYRTLSVKLHPDKNPAEDAEVKFRQLVGIYEVLRNKDLRESYDRVLIDGLPNWRQPIFYFRRARKLALWQVGVILLGIVSLGQYLAGWAAYYEKKLSMKEQIEARLRKTHRTKKGQKEGPTAQELEAEMELYLPKPRLLNLAPFQILRGIKYLVVQFPQDILAYHEELKQKREEELRRAAEEQERLERLELERQKAEEVKKSRKRKTFQPPELPETVDTQPVWNVENPGGDQKPKAQPTRPPPISGGLWTDDDLAELARLCSKFPGGTPERWEKIADILNRPVPEVTHMAKKVLEKLTSKPADEEPQVPQPKPKVKTKGGKADAIAAAGAAPQTDVTSVENWSAEEQKALEHALQCYPKGAIERWDKIAKMVPGRSKEDCILRFKYVAELVRKKKEKDTGESQAPEKEPESVRSVEPAPSSPPEVAEHSAKSPTSEPTVDEPGWEETKKSKKAARKAKKKAEAMLEPLEAVEIDSPDEPEPQPQPEPPKPVAKPDESEFSRGKPLEPEPPKAEISKKRKSNHEKPKEEPTVVRLEDAQVSPIAQPQSQAKDTTPGKAPQPLVEETVESQLESLVEESFISPEDPCIKESVRRTDSKSSNDGSESLVIIPDNSSSSSTVASKERSVERKSSSSSENDWCVVETTEETT